MPAYLVSWTTRPRVTSCANMPHHTSEGLFLLKSVHKVWKRWLLPQMYRHLCMASGLIKNQLNIIPLKNTIIFIQFSSVQLFSCVRLFATPWITACQASLSITNSQSLHKLMSIESVMPSSHLILSSPSPAFKFSQDQGLFKRVGSLHQVAKVLELQHQSFQWIFRIDFL